MGQSSPNFETPTWATRPRRYARIEEWTYTDSNSENAVVDTQRAFIEGERGQDFVEIPLPLVSRSVEHAEQSCEVQAEIAAIRLGSVFDIEPERLALEDPGVFGKEAKQDANQKTLQLMAAITAMFQSVVKIAHDSHGAKIDRVLVFKPMSLVARYEREFMDMAMQLGEREFARVDAETVE
ncbi:MAG TPA: hypothetical protein VGY55_10630, partial [Pirellulales bacterium]|nr:hypothetical protein [Pirellulales bacterium]